MGEQKKRYALHPGWIKSKNDGQMHYITASQLARLYNLKPSEWIKWDDKEPEFFHSFSYENFIHIGPRKDGDYILKLEVKGAH